MRASSRRLLDLVDVLPRLQSRDRLLLSLLSEHLVLTTTQISRALFSSTRMCQHRLHQLHGLELLDRFTPPRNRRQGGSAPIRWTLGRLGLDLHAAGRRGTFTSSRAARQRLAHIAESPTLTHLLGVNGFFTDLLAHTRTHSQTQLTRWWSEHEAARRFVGIHPDGHGLWRDDSRLIGFFLEYDTGTEDLPRVVEKLAAYERLARGGGPSYPVLFSLHSGARETHLHHALDGVGSRCPIATTVRDAGTDAAATTPAEAVWAVVGHDPRQRRQLSELDSDHGPDHPRNPNWHAGRLADDATVADTDHQARCGSP
jgi:hypothetical protein